MLPRNSHTLTFAYSRRSEFAKRRFSRSPSALLKTRMILPLEVAVSDTDELTIPRRPCMSIRDQVAHLIAFQELEHLTGQRFSEMELERMKEAAQAQGHTLEEALGRFLHALRNISQDDLAKVAKRREPPQ